MGTAESPFRTSVVIDLKSERHLLVKVRRETGIQWQLPRQRRTACM